jgi:hypothetical protein
MSGRAVQAKPKIGADHRSLRNRLAVSTGRLLPVIREELHQRFEELLKELKE